MAPVDSIPVSGSQDNSIEPETAQMTSAAFEKGSDECIPLSAVRSTEDDPQEPPDSAVFIRRQDEPDTVFSRDQTLDPSPMNAASNIDLEPGDMDLFDANDPFLQAIEPHAHAYTNLMLGDYDPVTQQDAHPEANPAANTAEPMAVETETSSKKDLGEQHEAPPITKKKTNAIQDDVVMADTSPALHITEGSDANMDNVTQLHSTHVPDSFPAKQASNAKTGRRKMSTASSRRRPQKEAPRPADASPSPASPSSRAMNSSLQTFFDKHLQASIKRRAEAAAADNEKDKLPSYGLNPNSGDADYDDEFEEDEAAASFRRMRQAFEEKKAMGTLSLKEEIHYRRMAQEEARRRANAQNAHHEDDADASGMFEPDSNGTDAFMDNMLRTRQRVYAEESGSEANALPSRKSKSSAPSQNSSRSKRGGKVSKTKGKGKDKRITEKQQRAQANLFNEESLGRQRLFDDIHENAAREEQPTFSATRKADAFKELIASIPEEARNTAKMDMKQLEAATKKFTGRGSCQALEGEWRVKGMKSRLTNYQMLGVSAMRERETTPNNSPTGGLHADAMGLGKTVMAIANIVNDRYMVQKTRKGTPLAPTLIVAPSSIIPQWKEECEKHAEADVLGKVNIHRPSQESGQDGYPNNFGIILTSYQQVMKSYPKQDPPVQFTTVEQKKKWWEDHYAEYKGFFHRHEWRRVVLDEATAIKNHHSQTAIACAELKAKYRWALTGTPAMNALDEFYSYFRFLQVRNVGSFHLFKKNFLSADNDDVQTGKERLIAFMRPFMIRRTHNDSLLGAKLLNLPKPQRSTYTCHFSKLHAQIYMVVQKRFIEKINIISKAGELRKQYTCILTLLLRLRQLTGHPLLIQDTMRDLLEPEDFDAIREILNDHEDDEDTMSDQALIIVHLRRMMLERNQLAQLDAVNSPVQGVSTPDVAAAAVDVERRDQSGSAWGQRDDFGGFIDDMRESSEKTQQEAPPVCVRCGKAAQVVIVTSCNHTYCRDCTFDDTRDAIAMQSPQNTCAACGDFYTTVQTYEVEKVAKESNRHAEAAKRGSGGFLKPGAAHKADAAPRVKIAEVLNTWLTVDKKMLPSAKTLAVKAQLLNWFAETPNVKVIIYTQFNTMIEILARICKLEGWSALKYNGTMSAQNRARQVKKFEEDGDTRILIASLRCGGLGLNLTMATRVLLVDPWWNAAVEEQAFCRTYRRGQTQETRMSRLVVHNTVDEHMIRLQERKVGEIESVMGDESRNKALPIDTLLELFGQVGQDEQGNAFVYTDDDDDPDARRGPLRNYMPGEDDEIVMGDSL